MKNRCLILLLAAASLMSGCATTIKNLGEYKSSPMMEADILPTPEQMESTRTKVVVFDADDGAVRQRDTTSGAVMTRSVESVLSHGGVEIIDRSLATALRDEVTLAEAKGTGEYSGPAVAAYALKPVLSNANYFTSFTQAARYCDPKTKKCFVIPPSCSHSASMNGSVRIYEVPSLRLLNTVAVSGGASYSTETNYCEKSADIAKQLINQAIENGVNNYRTDLQNLFAPKGYVVEKRTLGSKVIFKVMFGQSQGAKSQNKLKFYTLRREENAFTKKVDYEEIQVAEGVISDQISANYCWVVPDDKDDAKKIRLGDYVKIFYERSFFGR